MQRSVFGFVSVWNRLPDVYVTQPFVRLFQRKLMEHVRQVCVQGNPRWVSFFSPRLCRWNAFLVASFCAFWDGLRLLCVFLTKTKVVCGAVVVAWDCGAVVVVVVGGFGSGWG